MFVFGRRGPWFNADNQHRDRLAVWNIFQTSMCPIVEVESLLVDIGLDGRVYASIFGRLKRNNN